MLPGLIRMQWAPASIAFRASVWLKWMSAITGIGDSGTIRVRSASTSRSRGTAQRITSPPASATARIWRSVASTSAVSVFVIDCTTTGAPPPICTPPTVIWRLEGTALRVRDALPIQAVVSLETALARIQAIQHAFEPPAAPPAAAVAAPASKFAATLQSAMAPSAAPAAGATPQAGGAAGASFGKASPGQYPHLDGDLDCNPELLRRLEALAASKGQHFHITSGGRSRAEQQRLWDARGSNPYPVAPPGTSRHESGNAADVTIGGRAIQTVISAADLRAAGIAPLAGDAVHVELPH